MLGRGRGGLGIALAACLAALACTAPAADAYVYWGNPTTGTIGRAANDGTAVEPSFIAGAGDPVEVAVDAGHVYWADATGDAIGRARLDGTEVEPQFVSVGSEVLGVEVNETHVYWAATEKGWIGRAGIDGKTGFKADLVTGIPGPTGVALDSGHVYWSSASESWVGRAGLSGSAPDLDYVDVGGAALRGVAVNTGSIFFAMPGLFNLGTQLGRANTSTGKGVDSSFIGNAAGPCGVALLGSQLYWVNSGNNTIGRASTDSSGVRQDLVSLGGAEDICGVAVDGLAPPPEQQAKLPSADEAGPAGDLKAPETRIARGPGNRLADGRASFLFSASEAASFACKLDARKTVRCGRQGEAVCKALSPRCLAHRSYAGLKPGRHVFRVWATDAAGNEDPTPARRRFRVPG